MIMFNKLIISIFLILSLSFFILGLYSEPSGKGTVDDPFTGVTYIPAGPIFSHEQAKTVCPMVCDKFGGWSEEPWGSWFTTIYNQMSVCRCNIDTNMKTIMGEGTIWN